MRPADTITAIATPAGRGGIGIIRVSGADCCVIAEHLLDKLPPARFASYGCFYDVNREVIDQGITLWFPAPASFTGEDMLELHAHGSPIVLDLLLERILMLGARLAEPGEFSRRAFENGKYDLLQLEAVADLINSASRQAAKSAQRSLQGVFSDRVRQLLEAVINIRVLMETAIDFSDEDIDLVQTAEVQQRLTEISRQLTALQQTAQAGAQLCGGAEVVITGCPNVGKSSLLNCLAGQDEAIVSSTAGTTRDVLKCDLMLEGMLIRFLDTAGLCEPQNDIEAEGIRRAHKAMRNADLVLIIVDVTVGISVLERRLIDTLNTEQTNWMLIYNKSDLPQTAEPDVSGLMISAKTGTGIAEFSRQIRITLGTPAGTETAISARRRHLTALNEVQTAIQRAQRQPTTAFELIAEDLRTAQNTLATLTGEFTTEDLLGEIFSRFCIGK